MAVSSFMSAPRVSAGDGYGDQPGRPRRLPAGRVPHEALRWLRRGAEGGHAIAAHTLGRVYLEGDGVKRDRQEALVWFIVADARMALNGRTADERTEYARSTDALMRALPREQVDAARQRAQQILGDIP